MKLNTSGPMTKKGNIAYAEPGGGLIDAKDIVVQISPTEVISIKVILGVVDSIIFSFCFSWKGSGCICLVMRICLVVIFRRKRLYQV